jgi:hypothetical protein
MTKAKSKPCICCAAWNGACTKGHKPRFYKDGGLRRVCDDFATEPAPVAPSWLDSFMKIFGFRRA